MTQTNILYINKAEYNSHGCEQSREQFAKYMNMIR